MVTAIGIRGLMWRGAAAVLPPYRTRVPPTRLAKRQNPSKSYPPMPLSSLRGTVNLQHLIASGTPSGAACFLMHPRTQTHIYTTHDIRNKRAAAKTASSNQGGQLAQILVRHSQNKSSDIVQLR